MRHLVVMTTSLILFNAMVTNAQDSSDRARIVSVTGVGEVAAQPDEATIRFNVVTRDVDPETVRMKNADASQQAINSIRDLGVDEGSIQLEQLSLNAVREWDPEQRKHIEMGFEVNRGISVELVDLDLVPTIVAHVVQSGANRIREVRYGLSNNEQVQANALSKAVANARFKATTMLETLNETLGRAVEVREQSTRIPSPVARGYATAAVEKSSDPNPEAYAPGMIEISATVMVTFEIE